MKRIRIKHWLTALAALTAVACNSTTDPNEPQAFDPVDVSQDVQAAAGAFETDIYRSLDAMGENFTIPGANLSIAAVRSAASAAGGERRSTDLIDVSRRIAANYASNPAVVLIPDQYRGLTLTFDEGTGEYAVDDTRTDGPTNGVRFVLYAVDPVTRTIATPLNEIGHADLLDESTAIAGVVRMVVVSGTTEYINYTTTLSGTIITPSVVIEGFATDGTTQVDIDLRNSIAINVGGATITLDYTIAVPSRSFETTALLTILADAQGEEVSFSLDIQFTQGNDQVRIAGELVNDGGVLNVTVNGEPFAVITLTEQSITVTDAEGAEPLTPAEAAALEAIVDGFEDVFDSFDTFFNPVSFLFGGDGA